MRPCQLIPSSSVKKANQYFSIPFIIIFKYTTQNTHRTELLSLTIIVFHKLVDVLLGHPISLANICRRVLKFIKGRMMLELY